MAIGTTVTYGFIAECRILYRCLEAAVNGVRNFERLYRSTQEKDGDAVDIFEENARQCAFDIRDHIYAIRMAFNIAIMVEAQKDLDMGTGNFMERCKNHSKVLDIIDLIEKMINRLKLPLLRDD